MRRGLYVGVLAAAVLLMSGCSSKSNNMSQLNPGYEEIASKVAYDVVGPVEGKANVTTILGFLVIKDGTLTETKSGSFNTSIPTLSVFNNPARQAAIYNAIENADGKVDAVIAPRFTVSQKGLPLIFTTEDVTVKAVGVKFVSHVKKYK
jgi:hypothetical protein